MGFELFKVGYAAEGMPPPRPKAANVCDSKAARPPRYPDCAIWRVMFAFGLCAGFILREQFPKIKRKGA